MKKLLLLIFLSTSILTTVSSQILLSEDFDGIPGPTGGGPGTYLFPSGWTLFNVDAQVPAASVAYVNDAWERREDFANNVIDSAAFSTSWYAPPGASNDWMWTPAIALPSNFCQLSWNAIAYDPLYPDGYEVRILTAAPTLGNIGGSATLFSIPAENSTWTSRSVSLNGYGGQTVYIGFRNNSNDQFLLLIDDVVVEQLLNYDASITSVDTISEYTLTPVNQTQPMVLGGTVRNNGTNAVTNVTVTANVKDGANSIVYTASSTPIASLAPSATGTFTIAGYTPSAADAYTVEYNVSITEADQLSANDSAFTSQFISDTVYARDDGTVTGGLGIGAGNGGFLGNEFQVVNTDEVRSIMWYATRGYTGERYTAVIWDMVGGVPNSIVAYTDTLVYPDDSARVYEIPMDGGSYTIAPGNYVVTMVEFDSTIQVGQTNGLYTLGRTWVNWPTNPLGTWANNEDFGPGFSKTYVVRVNFAPVCNLTISATSGNASCPGCNDGMASATTTGANGNVTYLWSDSDTNAVNDSLVPGQYIVTATDEFGCTATDTVVVGAFTSTEDEASLVGVNVFPNPSQGQFTITLDHSAPFAAGRCELINVLGEMVYEVNIQEGLISLPLNITGMSAGNYLVKVYQGEKVFNTKVTIR